MIDRSLLAKADIEFVVVSDTHSMLPPGPEELEKESRRYQTERAERALKMISGLDPSFVVHLGDLVQEFPDMPGFEDSIRRALETMDRFGINACHVAGNHDAGDKPDPTMPTEPVTPESLEVYHSLIGPSWYSWDVAKWHFVVLNSQILNSRLEAENQQRCWLERDLSEHAGKPTVMFLHLAPFLYHPRETSIGHYHNIAEPARTWLIDLWDLNELSMV
jgi:3',5'-cyclic AMP phosphodiesterase CpdA